jgi:cell division protein ZipA
VPELTLRDAMVLVGSLLILAVMVDAWRRMRRQQKSRLRVKLATDIPEDDIVEDLTFYRELPNGGARVVHRDDFADPDDEAASESADGSPGSEGQALESTRVGLSSIRATKAVASEPENDRAARGDTRPRSEAAAPAEPDDDDSPLSGVSAASDEPANIDWLEDLMDHGDEPEEHKGGELPRAPDTEVIVLHVMSRDSDGFWGKDILEILLACDLRFGDMDFFHRHEQQAGRGPIQFSVANMLQPGVFDIDNMENMRTRGLVFFLTLPGPEDMIQAFDFMLETARVVSRNLGGELLDESRSVLTQQAVEHSRQQIRELERRLLAQRD